MTQQEMFARIERYAESISNSTNDIAEIMEKPRLTQIDRQTIVSELHNIEQTNDAIYSVAENMNAAPSRSIDDELAQDLHELIPSKLSAQEYDTLLAAIDDWRASIGLPKKLYF